MYDIPEDALPEDARLKEEQDPEVRISQADEDKTVEVKNEFYDGDTDNDKSTDLIRTEIQVLDRVDED